MIDIKTCIFWTLNRKNEHKNSPTHVLMNFYLFYWKCLYILVIYIVYRLNRSTISIILDQ